MKGVVNRRTTPKGNIDSIFKALADPSRRRMLNLLAKRELPLKQIEAQFEMSRPAIIKHMHVLRSCKLVEARKVGRETIHRLNSSQLRPARNWISEFDVFWDTHLQQLKRQVESKSF